jgi:hypothetical protein
LERRTFSKENIASLEAVCALASFSRYVLGSADINNTRNDLAWDAESKRIIAGGEGKDK